MIVFMLNDACKEAFGIVYAEALSVFVQGTYGNV